MPSCRDDLARVTAHCTLQTKKAALLLRLCAAHKDSSPASGEAKSEVAPAAHFNGALLSAEWVFRRVGEGRGLIVGDVADAEEAEDVEQRLAVMAEGHRAVVRIALFN